MNSLSESWIESCGVKGSLVLQTTATLCPNPKRKKTVMLRRLRKMYCWRSWLDGRKAHWDRHMKSKNQSKCAKKCTGHAGFIFIHSLMWYVTDRPKTMRKKSFLILFIFLVFTFPLNMKPSINLSNSKLECQASKKIWPCATLLSLNPWFQGTVAKNNVFASVTSNRSFCQLRGCGGWGGEAWRGRKEWEVKRYNIVPRNQPAANYYNP